MNGVIWPPRLRNPSYVSDVVVSVLPAPTQLVCPGTLSIRVLITYKIKVNFSVYQKREPLNKRKSMEVGKTLIRLGDGIPRSDNN